MEVSCAVWSGMGARRGTDEADVDAEEQANLHVHVIKQGARFDLEQVNHVVQPLVHVSGEHLPHASKFRLVMLSSRCSRCSGLALTRSRKRRSGSLSSVS
eukprot:1804365-Rhodomonas_salina.1